MRPTPVTRILAMTSLGALALAACAHGVGTAPVQRLAPSPAAALAAAPMNREAPVALQASDLALYLALMQTAADRVREPNAADRDAIARARAWSAAVDLATRSHAPPPAPLDEATLERSANLLGHMTDVEVASERGVDLARYLRIRATVDAIAANARACAANDCAHATASAPDDPRARVLARDRALLSPRMTEIRQLDAVVRAPHQPIDPP